MFLVLLSAIAGFFLLGTNGAIPWLSPGFCELAWLVFRRRAPLLVPLLGFLVVIAVRIYKGAPPSGPRPSTRTGSSCTKASASARSRSAGKSFASYDDDAAEFVALVPRVTPRGFALLSVPTHSEKDRVAVLAILVAKGIPRREA